MRNLNEKEKKLCKKYQKNRDARYLRAMPEKTVYLVAMIVIKHGIKIETQALLNLKRKNQVT